MSSTLVFFPWLKIRHDVDLGDYSLVPYARKEKPFGKGTQQQDECDGVLEPYYEAAKRPVDEAAILIVKAKPNLETLTDRDASECFIMRDVLSCAGIATREYYGFGFNYWNDAHFNIVIQNYADPRGSISTTIRRRDGQTTSHITRDAYHVYIPAQVAANRHVKVDAEIVAGLLKAKLDKKNWGDYHSAINNFVRANSDDDRVPTQQEAVMLIGAYQRLLRCGESGKEDKLAEEFMKIMDSHATITCQTSKKLQGTKYQIKSQMKLVEAWIRDFYLLRNEYAHGKTSSKKEFGWYGAEHLLLGSYLFPMLLKERLRQDEYNSSGAREIDLKVFEALIDANLSGKPEDQSGSGDWMWNRVLSEASTRAVIEKIMSQINWPEPS